VDDQLYDPRFFLPLTAQVCRPGAFVDRHLKLVESGVLGLSLASLSSTDSSMRSLGCTVLSRIQSHIQRAKKALSAEKQIWTHLIDVVRNGLQSEGTTVKRVPSVVTTFLVRACAILHSPLDPLYKPISSFVLAKPVIDLFSIPEFLRLFHSHSQPGGETGEAGQMDPERQFLEERHWILSVINDGLRDKLDYSVCQQQYLFKILMAFYPCSLADKKSRLLIASILDKVTQLQPVQPVLELIKNQGLLPWIADQVKSGSDDTVIPLVKLALSSWSKVSSQLHLTNREPQQTTTKGTFFNDIATEFHLLFAGILAQAALPVSTQTRTELVDAARAAVEAMGSLGTEPQTCLLLKGRLNQVESC